MNGGVSEQSAGSPSKEGRMVMHSGARASRGLGGQSKDVGESLESLTLTLTLPERKKLHPPATLFFSPRFTPCLMRS